MHIEPKIFEQLRLNQMSLLNLNNKRISDLEVQQLAKILESNTSLKVLSLESNLINVTGARALAEMLEKNSTLTSIFLGNLLDL